jgi:hypothetical protein
MTVPDNLTRVVRGISIAVYAWIAKKYSAICTACTDLVRLIVKAGMRGAGLRQNGA